MIKSSRVNTDLLAGIGGLAVTIVFWLSREPWMPLTAVWPNAILVFMLLCSLALIAKAFVKPERELLFVEGSRARMVVTTVALLVWGFGVVYVGFAVSSVLVFFFLWWYVGHAVAEIDADVEAPQRVLDYLKAGAVILVTVGVFYFIFSYYLYVPLPRGILI
jgi:hypothetical protein